MGADPVQCVEEMENLESVASGPKDKKKAAALDRLEELLTKNCWIFFFLPERRSRRTLFP